MARINGVNSDYHFKDGSPQKVDPLSSPLQLKLFICPGGQNNRLEADDNYCQGQNTSCADYDPKNPEIYTHHAMLQLHETDGVILISDNNNRLQLDQNGTILLVTSAGARIEMQKTGDIQITPSSSCKLIINGNVQITPTASGKVTINGNLEVTGTVNKKVI